MDHAGFFAYGFSSTYATKNPAKWHSLLFVRGVGWNFSELPACRPSDMPWLYYQEQDANAVLTDDTITTAYEFPNSMLGLIAAVFHPSGKFLGYRKVTGGLLQLCKNSDTFLDAAYVFGTTYEQSVSAVYFYIFF